MGSFAACDGASLHAACCFGLVTKSSFQGWECHKLPAFGCCAGDSRVQYCGRQQSSPATAPRAGAEAVLGQAGSTGSSYGSQHGVIIGPCLLSHSIRRPSECLSRNAHRLRCSSSSSSSNGCCCHPGPAAAATAGRIHCVTVPQRLPGAVQARPGWLWCGSGGCQQVCV